MTQNKTAYFVAVLNQKDIYGRYYQEIAEILKRHNFFVHDDVNHISPDEAHSYSDEKISKYFNKVESLIRNCDIFVAESSAPSPSVGFEVGLAVSFNKPVLILRHDSSTKGDLGAPFRANKKKITMLRYNEENLEVQISKFLKKAQKGIFVKRLPIEFTQGQIEYIEYRQTQGIKKSFNSTVREIIDEASDKDNSFEK